MTDTETTQIATETAADLMFVNHDRDWPPSRPIGQPAHLAPLAVPFPPDYVFLPDDDPSWEDDEPDLWTRPATWPPAPSRLHRAGTAALRVVGEWGQYLPGF